MAPVAEDAYPPPIINRNPASSTPPPAPTTTPSVPRTRVFPFSVRAGSVGRRSMSLPMLRGPIILKEFAALPSGSADPVQDTIELGWSASVVRENQAGITDARPYTRITERQDPDVLEVANIGSGFTNSTIGMSVRANIGNLDVLIDAPEVFLVIACIAPGVTGHKYQGHVTVIENVSRDALAFFH